MNKKEQLEKVSRAITRCKKCDLCKNRHNAVVGAGNICSNIMIVGEGPGYNEDMTGNAFVGKAGQLLDKELAAIGLDRTKVYISNIVKCRPPNNRNPLPAEQDACMDYLRMQFMIQKPKLIILLGAVASKRLLNPDFRITKEHDRSARKRASYSFPPFIRPLC